MQFHCIKLSQYFLKQYEPFGGDINVKVDLSNYPTTTDIKKALHIDTSSFALKSNLASLKTEVRELSLRTVLDLENFLMFGKEVILFQSIKKGVNN